MTENLRKTRTREADHRGLSSCVRPRRIGRALALRHAAACLSLTARLSSLGFWSGGFCRRSTLQPSGAWLKPRPSLTHAALVAGAQNKAGAVRFRDVGGGVALHSSAYHRVTQVRGGRGSCRWNCKTSNPVGRPGSVGVRRASASSVGQRAAIFGRGSSLSPTRATRAPPAPLPLFSLEAACRARAIGIT